VPDSESLRQGIATTTFVDVEAVANLLFATPGCIRFGRLGKRVNPFGHQDFLGCLYLRFIVLYEY